MITYIILPAFSLREGGLFYLKFFDLFHARQSMRAHFALAYSKCSSMCTHTHQINCSRLLAVLSTSAEISNVPCGQVQFIALFYTLDNIPVQKHLAFVIFTANNETLIIGTKEAPFPTFKISKSTGSPSGDPAVKKYEVTFKGKRTLIPCII